MFWELSHNLMVSGFSMLHRLFMFAAAQVALFRRSMAILKFHGGGLIMSFMENLDILLPLLRNFLKLPPRLSGKLVSHDK